MSLSSWQAKISAKPIINSYLYIFFVIIIISLLSGQAGAETEDEYYLDAENIQYDYNQEKIYADREVYFTFNELEVRAEEMTVSLNKSLLEARGEEVVLQLDDQTIKGEYLRFDYSRGEGQFFNAQSEVGQVNFSGGTINLVVDRDYDLLLEEATFTPCIMEEPHYSIRASEVRIYPEDRIRGTDVELWWGGTRLIGLPAYVVNYEEVDDEYKFSHPFPLSLLGYDSETGFEVGVDYPYQLTETVEGSLLMEFKQRGDSQLEIDNYWYFYDHYFFQSKLNLEQDDEDWFYEVYQGINYNPDSSWEIDTGLLVSDLAKNFPDNPALKGLSEIQYTQGLYDFQVNLAYFFAEEESEIEAEITRDLPGDNKLLLENDFIAETGFLGLKSEPGFKLADNLELEIENLFKINYTEYDYTDFSQELVVELGADFEYQLAEQFSLQNKSSLQQELLWRDFSSLEKDELNFVTETDFRYDTDEPESFWQISSRLDYDIKQQELDEINLGVRREYDCYSLGFNYDFSNDIIGFDVNF